MEYVALGGIVVFVFSIRFILENMPEPLFGNWPARLSPAEMAQVQEEMWNTSAAERWHL